MNIHSIKIKIFWLDIFSSGAFVIDNWVTVVFCIENWSQIWQLSDNGPCVCLVIPLLLISLPATSIRLQFWEDTTLQLTTFTNIFWGKVWSDQMPNKTGQEPFLLRLTYFGVCVWHVPELSSWWHQSWFKIIIIIKGLGLDWSWFRHKWGEKI